MALLKPRYNIAKFFLITMYLFFPLAPSTFGEDDDAAYMTELAKALTPTPPGWSPDVHFCKWRAIKCDGSNRVTGISLFSLPLTGTIPAGLNSLSQLTTLGLAYSSLSGPLPSLENLSMLTYAIFENSSFTSIPNGCFKGLTSLLVLTLSNNINLAPWTFPADLAQSTGLVTLKLDTTNMIGSLPNIFDSLGRLDYLSLSNNSISGDLPKSFADSGISHLFLDNQKDGLSGTIDVLSSMTELSQVWLQNNQFTGPIPDLSNCTNLFDLQLQDNKLTGVIPYSLMHHSSLQNISLDNNYFQGPRPLFDTAVKVTLNGINTFCIETPGPCDPRVTTLLEIAAAFGYPIRLANSWLGNNPCKNWNFIICQEEKIVTVNLGKLNLTGTISPAFANLTDLINLDLSVNNLIGPIPVRLTSLQQLETLNLSYNNLSGPLPRFAARVKLDIAGNVLLLGRNGTEGNVTPNQNYSKTAKGSSVLRWIAGALAASVGLLILIVIIFKRKRCISLVQSRILKKPCSSHDINVENFIKNHSFLAPKRYSFSEVKRITNSFQNKLGQGGFGVVYKGSLHDGRHVAIKVLSEVTGSGDEFINEVASISKTSHVNIVSLLGFCYERNNRALIYEFMANGSLDKFIYKKGSPNAICNLDWSILYEIAIGIARGLEYLHRGCSTRILHFDIKPQNILLDEDFCPKISDFGLAKLCKKKESIVSILGTRGTVGYIAPEVFSRAFGRVSHKSDVFSYGMLIIEMIGGRKNYASGGSHSSEMFFPDWIYKDIEQGNIPKNCLVNSREENDMVMKMTLLSLWCIQTQPSDRPSMSKVVDMFEGPLQAVPSPPKPVLYYPKRETVPISDISSSNIHVTNSITIQQDVPSNQILSSTKT